MKHRLLWITDPWKTLDHAKDTTLRLIEESLVLEVPTWWCDVRSIRFQENAVQLEAREVQGVFPGRAEKSFRLGPTQILPPQYFTQIHYRTDPPVDRAYLHPLQLLALALEGPAGPSTKTEMVNPLPVLFGSNEKMMAARLGSLMPLTVISSQEAALTTFGKERGQAVLKPLHEAQSHGVELLSWKSESDSARSHKLLQEATGGFEQPVVLQQYLAGISEGEQRLWYLDGKLLACARKRPKAGTFKVDMDQGGSVVRSELSSREQRTAIAIGRFLARAGIRLAAVDLIEGMITDFNFTSPGLIVQMEQLLGENLSRQIIKSLIGQRESPVGRRVSKALSRIKTGKNR